MQNVHYYKEKQFTKVLLEQSINMFKFSELISTDNIKLLNLLTKHLHKYVCVY